ncbi:type I-E CRISPR-associated protein Cas6/Cse3/CasE [Streptomyces sp. ACA25]|uniref:type I-E CRISPR-associated protein Cas6/Cse3/CasE n=1 Tax=Streptomyces sp. ACA25 TaxID=3022596 RepID=UPI002307E55F|nr:type I-E CRISPR-associated protein Cas6/Cse3/CasE [Streptomyces sp. ACA25]MDB1087701.1 type I-E CRISPR-associated protein Cas6/Cse3/CasE [Streptomyces sp. ACA25]
MHLTRFRFNTARGGARKLLSSPQALHAAVMSSFADVVPGAPDTPRVLWRTDHNARAEVFLYLVSPDKPDLTHLVEQAGWPTTATWQTYDYSAFLSRLTTGSTWAFRLTANPEHSIRRKPGEPTKRTAHLTPAHQMAWLLQRQEKAGFRVVEKPEEQRRTRDDVHELIVHDRRSRSFDKRHRDEDGGTSRSEGDVAGQAESSGRTGQGRGRAGRVTLVTATFDGRLRVTDADKLRRTLTAGLGRAKAYGCGLMTLAPVS